MKYAIPLVCALGLTFALAGCNGSGGSSPAPPMNMDMRQPMGSPLQHPGVAETGTTPGWFDGRTITFVYHTNNFFCRTPVADGLPVGSTSGCEVGSDGTVDPRPGNIPILYVMTPVGFTPPVSTLHCPVVGNCINHPHTIDLSRLFGPTTANAPLPAHSHIVTVTGQNWWELHVIGVKDIDTWNTIVAGKSLATVRALQASDPSHTHIGAETLTNLYLFFEAKPR
jgi:hypothetical protein